jgi:hypothetical protein
VAKASSTSGDGVPIKPEAIFKIAALDEATPRA